METSVLATREVGLVIMGSGSTTNVGEYRPVITIKPVAARIGDAVGVKTGSLWTQTEAQSALRLVWWKAQALLIGHRQITSEKGSMLNNATVKNIDLRNVQCDGAVASS